MDPCSMSRSAAHVVSLPPNTSDLPVLHQTSGHFSEWFVTQNPPNDVIEFGGTLNKIKAEWKRTLVSAQTRDDMPRIMSVIGKIRAALEKAASIIPASKMEAIWNLMRSALPSEVWDFDQPEIFEEQSRSLASWIFEREDQKQNKLLPEVPKNKDFLNCIPADQGKEFRRDNFGQNWGKSVEAIGKNEGLVAVSTMENYRSAFNQCMATLRLLFTLRWVHDVADSLDNDTLLEDEWPSSLSPDTTVHPSELLYHEEVCNLWRVFGQWLSFEVVCTEKVYSSDLDRVGINDTLLKFQNMSVELSVMTKLNFAKVSYVDQFLATLLGLTSGLNFNDWCWGRQERAAVLPVGLLLCPAGVLRAQFQPGSRRCVVDEKPLFDQEADDAVFALLWATSVRASALAVTSSGGTLGTSILHLETKDDNLQDLDQEGQSAGPKEVKEWPWNDFYVSQFGSEKSHAELLAARLALLSHTN